MLSEVEHVAWAGLCLSQHYCILLRALCTVSCMVSHSRRQAGTAGCSVDRLSATESLFTAYKTRSVHVCVMTI